MTPEEQIKASPKLYFTTIIIDEDGNETKLIYYEFPRTLTDLEIGRKNKF